MLPSGQLIMMMMVMVLMIVVMMIVVMMIVMMKCLQDGVMYKPGARFYDEATDSTLVAGHLHI